MSVFIGSQLSALLDNIEKNVQAGKMTPENKTELKLDIGKIPQIMLDNTDRNRTSPFAFTGNKFEFRAVGSSANCASAMIVINTIVTNQLRTFKQDVDKRIGKGASKDEAILKELQQMIKASKKIRFEGNGYGEDWVKDAEKRGLSNLKDTPRALEVWSRKEVIQLFDSIGVLSPRELEARKEIELDGYILKIQIEARIMGDVVQSMIIPAAVQYQNTLIENVRGLMEVLGAKSAKSAAKGQTEIIEQIAHHMNAMKSASDSMLSARKKANQIDDLEKRAFAYCDDVRIFFDEIRYHADKLELLIDDEHWPLPKFREMLFTR
jgi:glutamine synthetase